MRVVIAGGGTGGHLFPGIALAHEFKRQRADATILFVGTAKGLENRIIPQEGFELRLIPIGGLVRQGGFQKIRTLWQLPASLWRSLKILREVRPDLVIGVGGYASGPVMAIARLLRLPRVLVEPNAVPGLTNRWLGPWVNRIYVAFEDTRQWFRGCAGSGAVRVFGNPVRRDILSAADQPKSRSEKQTLLVMGGSQGSRAINRAMHDALPGLEPLRSRLRIIHQSGEQDAAWLKAEYDRLNFEVTVVPFLSPISEAYREADLVVSRSGATTVAELSGCGRPAILIPFSYATHRHQEKNALVLMENGGAEMILERDLSGEGLGRTIRELLSEPDRLRGMADAVRRLAHPEAAEKIVSDCLTLVR